MRTSTFKIVIGIISFFSLSAGYAFDTSSEEKTCVDIGFKRKTEAFGSCVLELVNRGGSTGIPQISQQYSSNSGDLDDAACRGYGFKPNTSNYSSCRLQIDLAKQNAKQQQDIYLQQKSQYDEQVAAMEKQKTKERNLKQLEMGLRMMGGQTVQDAAMATARMPPLPQPPGQITQRITMPNGRGMTCTTLGANTNCF